MLFLAFELDGDRYVLDATEIIEVTALTPFKRIPRAPQWIAGTVDLRGASVPAIDVAQLALGRPFRRLRSTRLVVVRYFPDATREHERRLALIVERATQTLRIERSLFSDSGIATPNARWLGPVATDDLGFVQWISAQRMLDDDSRSLLFPLQESLFADKP